MKLGLELSKNICDSIISLTNFSSFRLFIKIIPGCAIDLYIFSSQSRVNVLGKIIKNFLCFFFCRICNSNDVRKNCFDICQFFGTGAPLLKIKERAFESLLS